MPLMNFTYKLSHTDGICEVRLGDYATHDKRILRMWKVCAGKKQATNAQGEWKKGKKNQIQKRKISDAQSGLLAAIYSVAQHRVGNAFC